MRLIAATLAMVSAAFLISGVAPTLSGMQVSPQCEAASQSSSPLSAPTNLRIISRITGIGFEGLSARGPNAGAEVALQTPPRAGDPHAYYGMLASRRDCFAAYSLRNQAQIEQYRTHKNDRPTSVFYLYPNDRDPRQQDAAKVVLEGADDPRGATADLRTQIILPIGPHHPQNLLVTWDVWYGAEWDYNRANIWIQKGMPQFGSPDDNIWLSLHANFKLARQHEHNQPPGGPYVVMTHPHSSATPNVKAPFFRDGNAAGRQRLRLPYGAPAREQRTYSEGVGPLDASIRPEGMEFGVVAERWTRYWAFFERAEREDWLSDFARFTGKTMPAYKWSVWAADTVRDPVRILDEAIVAVHPDSPGGFGKLRIELDVSAADDRIPAGRGDLITYTRNYVVLHGTQKADVLAMLQKPTR
jgi:hypothetical protein